MTDRLTIECWYSPAAQCWRVEDGDMHTYAQLSDVVTHLKRRDARAHVDQRWPNADRLTRALTDAGIDVAH